ncbi:uncharacterized protein LOC120334883 [Styela clava]
MKTKILSTKVISANANMIAMFILLELSFLTTAAPIPNTEDLLEVPEIENCAYVNAYYVTCWWKRPKRDTASDFRLGYISAADAHEVRLDKYCSVTEQSIDGDVITESCGIHGTMYGKFTLWVASVHDCDAITGVCQSFAKSKEIDFTCMGSNVKLTIPPSSLQIVDDGERLTWEEPERMDSMLSFALHRRKVLYKVEYRELLNGEKATGWEDWYIGPETSAFLPTLVPGSTYELRVSASMDPSEADAEREWTRPSNVLVFMVPKTARITSEVTLVDLKEDTKINEPFTSSNRINDVIRPVQVSKKVIIASAVTSFIIVVALAIAGYFFQWRRYCCCLSKIKFSGPKLFVNFKDESIHDPGLFPNTNEKSDGQCEKGAEVPCPITQHMLQKPVAAVPNNPSNNNNNHTRYFALSRREERDVDFGRQRLLSSSKNLDDTFSLNEILDSVDGHDEEPSTSSPRDVLIFDDVTTRNNSVSLQNRNPWKLKSQEDIQAIVKNFGSVKYVKLGPQDSDMPSYLFTNDKNDVTILGSLDRTMSDYVTDDTGIESAFTNDLSDVTGDITSSEDFDEEKFKQWQKQMMDSDAISDGMPDYVTHAPSFNKDFSQNMTMFVSMATEDVTQRQPINVYDAIKKESPIKCDDINDYSHFAGESSRVVIMTMCPSCKNAQTHEKCTNGDNRESREVPVSLPVGLDRRGSVSENSIDSGYSPDTPDCATLPSSEKDTLLSSRFELAGASDNENSDNDGDYMTYVTT